MSISGKPIIALVPARGGSKGVPGKNMRKICGIPLVGYTIQAAMKSIYVDQVYITSDDEQTLSYGRSIGANTIHRPAEFSNDTASANSVVEHFLGTLTNSLIGKNPYIAYLQPTSPLRTAKHLDDAFIKMRARNLHKLISVVEMTDTPFKSFVLNQHGRLEALFDERMTNKRRQDLPVVYLPNGAIYIFPVSDFRHNNSFPSNGSYPYIMSKEDSLDIDTESDFDRLNEYLSKQ